MGETFWTLIRRLVKKNIFFPSLIKVDLKTNRKNIANKLKKNLMFPILLVNIIAFHFSLGPRFSYNLMYFSLITTDLRVQASSKHNKMNRIVSE